MEYIQIHANYSINEYGLVKNINTGKILKPYLANGYLKVDLYIESKRAKMYIHTLLGVAFKADDYFTGAVINHKDGNRLNNDLDNIEWCTYSQNCKHAYEKLGRVNIHKRGSESKMSKKINAYDFDGNLVESFGSITEAQKKYGTCIEKHLSGKRKTAYGYKWKYA